LKIFLAAPLFNEAERDFNAKVAANLRKEGFDVWLAQEQPFIKTGSAEEKRSIFNHDIEALKKCDFVLAILDGLDVEAGVAFEMGYAKALGKPIVGLKTDYRTFSNIESINLMLEVPLICLCNNLNEVIVCIRNYKSC